MVVCVEESFGDPNSIDSDLKMGIGCSWGIESFKSSLGDFIVKPD